MYNPKKEIKKQERIAKRDERDEKMERYSRPYLLRRFTSGMLDLFFIAILFIGLFVFAQLVLFKPLGFFRYTEEAKTLLKESGLYIELETNSFYEVTTLYTDEEELISNAEERITFYYSNNSRALETNKLEKYNESKETSGLFDYVDNNYVAKEGLEEGKLLEFYKEEYSKAVDFFEEDINYINPVNRSQYIMIFTMLICMVLSTAIIYLIIPLLRKEGETPAQIINKICIIDSRDLSQVKRWQIVVRFLVLVSINFYLPFLFYFTFNYFTLVPDLIFLFMIAFLRYNRGPHDFLSYTYVILKKRSDAMDALKQLTNRGL